MYTQAHAGQLYAIPEFEGIFYHTCLLCNFHIVITMLNQSQLMSMLRSQKPHSEATLHLGRVNVRYKHFAFQSHHVYQNVKSN